MEILTNRLRLRYFQIEDVYDVFEYSKNPNVANAAAWMPHPNIDYSILIVRKFIRKKEIAICLKDSNKVIGSIGVFDTVNKELGGKEISFALCEKHWGQGLMKEALNSAIPYIVDFYGVDKLYCCAFLDNEKSQSSIKGMGFTELGKYNYALDEEQTKFKEVMYYQLNYKDFYHFKYSFTEEEYIKFRNLVGWDQLDKHQIENVVKNSNFMISIYDHQGEQLGIARCISDNAYIYLMCDVMVDPKCQGKGVGKRMIEAFIKYIGYGIGNEYAKIYIMSLKGKEGFYESLGFSEEFATGLTIIKEKK